MLFHIDHPDDERFDEIHISIVERWKDSELSGDEWRFSYLAEVKRKGEIVIRITASTLDWLLKGLQWKMLVAGQDHQDGFDSIAYLRTKDKCDQPGCANIATIFYQLKKDYSKCGEELVDKSSIKYYRQFCQTHEHRGDCGLSDSDDNYFVIENPNKEK